MAAVTNVDTLIVGAGISGLAYAAFRGFESDLVVLEAAQRAGGLIRTRSSGDVRFEDGPESIQGRSEAVRELFQRAEVEVRPLELGERYLVHRGRLERLPSSPAGLAGSRILSASGKARALLEPTRAVEKAIDGSIAEFAEHRFGREVAETFVDAFVGGVHAGDPAQLSLQACFPELVAMLRRSGSVLGALKARSGGGGDAATGSPVIVRPLGGMQRLTDALAQKLGRRLVLGAAVEQVEREERGWSVRTSQGAWTCRNLVWATSYRALVERLTPNLPGLCEVVRRTGLQHESLSALVSVWDRAQVAHALDGFGYLAPHREGLRHLGTLFSSSIDPSCAPSGTVVLRTLFGGARRAELALAPEAELHRIVREEVAPLLEIRGDPRATSVSRWRDALPRYDLQHPARVQALEAAIAAEKGLTLLGNYLRGIGIPALIGAARERAARG